MSKSFVVIGLGNFGTSVAHTLAENGHDVLAIDNNEDLVEEASEYVTHAINADVTNEEVLKSLDIKSFDAAIVAIGVDIQSSILATVMLKELGAKYILAKAQNDLHSKTLYKVGADRVVFVERDMGIRIAHNLIMNNIIDMIELSSSFSIAELQPLPSWIGKTLNELQMRSKHGINVVAIKKEDSIDTSPTAESQIDNGDMLLVFGHNKNLSKLNNEKQ